MVISAGTPATSHDVVDASVEDPACGRPLFAPTGWITFTSNGASFTATVPPGNTVAEFESFHAIDYSFDLELDVNGGDCGKIFDGGTLTGSIGH